MTIKTFKTIYRIDYPAYYSIMDKFGSYIEMISKNFKNEPFKNFKRAIDIVNLDIISEATINEDPFKMHMSLNVLDAVIEHPQGYDLDIFAKHPLVKLSDDLICKLEEDGLSDYDRIGLRTWILIEDPLYTFDKLLSFFCSKMIPTTNSLSNSFSPTKDIGIVFESENSEGVKLRILYGPYKSDEVAKYFSFDSPIGEGLIFDIDLFQGKIKMPHFDLTKLVKKYQDIIIKIVKTIDTDLKQELRQ